MLESLRMSACFEGKGKHVGNPRASDDGKKGFALGIEEANLSLWLNDLIA